MKSGGFILGGMFLVLAGAAAWLLLTEPEADRGRSGARSVFVVSQEAEQREFSDIIEALGTAKARESVVLVSPVSEAVTSVRFEDGQIVRKGDLLLELENKEETAQFQEAEANLKEAAKQFSRVQNLVENGNASNASLDAERRQVEEARFRLAAAQARLSDRRITAPFDIRAEIANEDHALRPGLLMTVDVISSSRQAVSVPEESVIPTAGKNYVFVIKGDEAERREVKLGLRRPGYVEVIEGVAAGERVVVQGAFRLGNPGTKVQETAPFNKGAKS